LARFVLIQLAVGEVVKSYLFGSRIPKG
jgi:hypothetical protein